MPLSPMTSGVCVPDAYALTVKSKFAAATMPFGADAFALSALLLATCAAPKPNAAMARHAAAA